MKVDLLKLSTQEVESTTASKKMRLSDNASSMVFQMFTRSVYSNPIGTIVREITSNCFDSHVEAGVDSPVLIKHFIDSATEQHNISFIDYGVGISPDRMENVYGVYFESTKRVDNEQIGGFGIGAKSALAYKRFTGLGEGEYDNSFYVITSYNNKKYYYMVYEGDESPIFSLLHTEDTEESNGTEVRIPVLEKDLQKFGNEIIKQLYYFENLVFEGFDEINSYVTNEYKIVKANSFLFRGNNLDNAIHICLGRVAYPIDYSALGLNSRDYRLPLALKIEIGEINPTVSREAIDYSEQTIELLKTKLDEAMKEMEVIVKDKYSNIVTLEQYYRVKSNYGFFSFDGINEQINVRDLITFKNLDLTNFKYNFLKLPNFSQLINLFFKIKTYGDKKAYRGNFSTGIELLDYSNTFYCPDVFNRKVIKQGYLADEFTKFHIITKVKDFLEENIHTVCSLFNVSEQKLFNYAKKKDDEGNEIWGFKKVGTTDFAKSIVELQNEMSDILNNHLEDYDDVEPTEEFIEKRQNARKRIDFKGINFTVNTYNTINTYFDTRNKVEFDVLGNFKGRIYYCTSDNESQFKMYIEIFRQLFPLIKTQRIGWNGSIEDSYTSYSYTNNKSKTKIAKILFIRVAKTNLKYVQALDNANPIEDIVQTLLRRKFDQLETFLTYEKVFNSYDKIPSFYKHENMKLVSGLTHRRIGLIKTKIEGFKLKAGVHTIDFTNFTYLQSFKNLANISDSKPNKEVVKLQDRIDKIQAIGLVNAKTLEYLSINIEYLKQYDTELQVEILQKLMKF